MKESMSYGSACCRKKVTLIPTKAAMSALFSMLRGVLINAYIYLPMTS